jgi:hypothetical protein
MACEGLRVVTDLGMSGAMKMKEKTLWWLRVLNSFKKIFFVILNLILASFNDLVWFESWVFKLLFNRFCSFNKKK